MSSGEDFTGERDMGVRLLQALLVQIKRQGFPVAPSFLGGQNFFWGALQCPAAAIGVRGGREGSQ